MLFAALSCFQGLTMQESYDKLYSLGVDGIQLTPGNIPTKDFNKKITIRSRYHHTFSFDKKIGSIYDSNYKTNVHGSNHSIHPPKKTQYTGSFASWFMNVPHDTLLEIMYPAYHLSNDSDINLALDRNQPVAVDISHLHICHTQKTISQETLKRILNYTNIQEIHFSHNNGKHDTHQLLSPNSPFFSWGKEQVQASWIYESLLRKSTYSDAMRQLEFLR